MTNINTLRMQKVLKHSTLE